MKKAKPMMGMGINDAVKTKVFKRLDECLDKLVKFDIHSLMPLFYVLVAHHEGHLVSIIGGVFIVVYGCLWITIYKTTY